MILRTKSLTSAFFVLYLHCVGTVSTEGRKEMMRKNVFLSIVLSGALMVVPVHGVTINSENCSNPTFRRYNPDQCKNYTKNTFSFATSTAVAGGALAAIGASLALIGTSSSSNTASSAPATTNTDRGVIATHSPTLPVYNHVGNDVTKTQLAAAMETREYTKNYNQYNEIRAAYSLARGFTGKNSTIAILDTGDDLFHGQKVAQLASNSVAPDATVNSYKVYDDNNNFLPFKQIGNIINTIDDANIYNASWVISNRYADTIKNRKDLVRLTDETFISAIETAARERDAIFVWAAGNNGANQANALSALPNISSDLNGHFINVVAWDEQTGALADFSNACGVTMNYCITAPGTNLSAGYSTRLDGTSFAAPIVSAAVAVIREAFPYMKSTQITELLFATARDLGEDGVDAIYGHGMLDLERATRPVGTELIPITENIARPLETARVSSTIAHQIKSENLQLAFVDDFGRTFTTKLNDKIQIQNQGRGFTHLRQEKHHSAQIGNFEFGMRTSDFLGADGFLSTTDKTSITYIATNSGIDTGFMQLFQRTEFGISNPHVNENTSVVTNFSNIYTASVTLGANVGNWTLSVATNDTIISGTMNMRLPAGRNSSGTLLYNDYKINLTSRPAIEYSIGYKNITAAFVDNPYGTDEIYVLAKSKFRF